MVSLKHQILERAHQLRAARLPSNRPDSFETPPDSSDTDDNAMSDDGNEEHPGINCDGCGVKPIQGACYRRQAEHDSEDFCQICFDQLADDEKDSLRRVRGCVVHTIGDSGDEGYGNDWNSDDDQELQQALLQSLEP